MSATAAIVPKRPGATLDRPRSAKACAFVQEVTRAEAYPEGDYRRTDLRYQRENFDANRKVVGVATSRGYSYYFRHMLSLGMIDIEHSEPGTEVTVVWGNPGESQQEIRATVAPAPYKKDNRRLDVTTV